MSRQRIKIEFVTIDVKRSACHPSHFDGQYQTELFFADSFSKRQQAVAICQGCEIREECLADARARREDWGIWGGREFRRGRDFTLGRIRHIAQSPHRR